MLMRKTSINSTAVAFCMVDLYFKLEAAKISREKFVASTGIEPVSGASETLILSIVLRGRVIAD